MKKIIPLAIAAVLLSGCAAQASSEDPDSTATPTPAPPPAATVQQFASVIAEHTDAWIERDEMTVDCAMAEALGDDVLDDMQVTTCKLLSTTVTLKANTALRAFEDLGEPPPELGALIARTIPPLEDLASVDVVTACEDADSQECEGANTLVNGKIRPVVNILDAWGPYL